MTNNPKKQYGLLLGISVAAFVIWYLFLNRKGKIPTSLSNSKTPKPSSTGESSGSSGNITYKSSGSNHTLTYTTGNSGYPLKQGSTGELVRVLQFALQDAGYNVGSVDGVWGSGTQRAFVQAFNSNAPIQNEAEFDWFLYQLEKDD